MRSKFMRELGGLDMPRGPEREVNTVVLATYSIRRKARVSRGPAVAVVEHRGRTYAA
jgi:hypothetical protein